jgi:3-hydroxyacyl-[acyl-carrier-protein] dehydratase
VIKNLPSNLLQTLDCKNVSAVSDVVLQLLPQTPPFRFLDKIIEIDDDRIVGQYTFRQDEWFYRGHFPDEPVTPGVILIETMAQTSVVALGIYLSLREAMQNPNRELTQYRTVFTEVTAEFLKKVSPGDMVTVKAEKIFFRRRKIKSKAALFLDSGELAATAELSGIGIERP